MKRKDSLTPYPILDINTNDYMGSKFRAEIKTDFKFKNLYLIIDFELDNDEISNYIHEYRMCFAVHVESPSTSYRKIFKTYDLNITEKLELHDIGSKVEVIPFILVQTEIMGYTNKKFNDDYAGYEFDFEAGNVVATYPGKEILLEKDNNLFDNIPSIIKVFRSHDKLNGTITVDTDGTDYISIGVLDDLYDKYYALGKRKFKSTVLSLVIFPSMITVLTRMIDAEGDEKEKIWYQVISQVLERNGVQMDDLTIDNKKNSVISIAQKLFSNPISNSFYELESINPRG